MQLPDISATPFTTGILAFFCLITLVQLFYYLFFFTRLAFKGTKKRSSSQTHAVSVIICARDEAKNISLHLPSILEQTYPSTHEVIVVNDNSHDESRYILEDLRRTCKKLHHLELKQEAKHIPGKKFPLSIGIKTAKYEVLLLTDADCAPASPYWLEKMQAAYTPETEIVLGYGPYRKRKGLLNLAVRWETFHTALQYLSYAQAGLAYMGVGRNLSYKKALFFKHKGFSAHNHLPGGDDDLFINKAAGRKNVAIVTDPDSYMFSEAPKTWKQWRNQKKRHYTTSKYYSMTHKFLLGLYSLSHFLYYPLLVAALLVNWQIALTIFGIRFTVQTIVLYRTTRVLHEKDLFPWFLFLDLWMFFYYLLFGSALVKKPASHWK